MYRKSSSGGKGAEQHTSLVADNQDMEYNVDIAVAAPRRGGDACGEGFVAAKRRPSLKDLLFPFASAHEPDHHHCENKIASFAQKFMKDRGIPLAADKESLSSSDEDSDYDGFELPTLEQQEVREEGRGEEHEQVVREGGHKSREESDRHRRKEKESRSTKRSGSGREHHHHKSIDEEKQPAASSSSTTSKRTRRSSSHRESSSSSHRTNNHRSDSLRSSKPRRSSESAKEDQSSSYSRSHHSSSSSARRHHSIGTAPRPHLTTTSAHGSSSARRHHSIGTATRSHLTTTSAHGSSSSARRHHSIGTATRSHSTTTTTMLDSDVFAAAKNEDEEEAPWDFTDFKSVEGDWWDPQPLVSSAAATATQPKRVKTTVRSNGPNAICA
jgi:hypothetical protein